MLADRKGEAHIDVVKLKRARMRAVRTQWKQILFGPGSQFEKNVAVSRPEDCAYDMEQSSENGQNNDLTDQSDQQMMSEGDGLVD